MSGLTSALKLLKGGLVVLDVATGAVRRTISLQYNPDTLTRSNLGRCGPDREESARRVSPGHELSSM